MQRALRENPGEILLNQALEWIRQGDLDRLGAYLISGSVHGKPGLPTTEMNRLEKSILKALPDEEIFALGKKLLARPEYAARGLGAGFIERGWPKHKEVEKLLLKAAEDPDWIVREIAAFAFARMLEKDFAHFAELFARWAKSGGESTKRAVALAVKYDSKSADPKRWKTYLRLIEPLLEEEAEYIRKNLGPFAIGDGLLSRFPEETLKACGKWARSRHPWVRWNTAMVFTAAAARRFSKEGRKILAELTHDENPMVSRAAKRAEKNLAK